jgi:hypothetical protein
MKNFVFILFFSVTVISYGQEKYALVIGNSNYTHYGTLRNSINDANDMRDVLTSLGFTVSTLLDGNLAQMEEAAISLKNRLNRAGNNSIGFFYYAGHGLEMGGVNYLIPANANIPNSNFLRERAFSVQVMLDMLNDSRNALNVVILDACRDFPATWSRTLNRGLSVVSNPPANHIIMYSTGAGQVASDGTGRNGLFTSHLIKNLKQPLDVNEIFRRTIVDVTDASKSQQRPALYTDFGKNVYFGSPPVQPSPGSQQVVPPLVTIPPSGSNSEQIIIFNPPFQVRGIYWFYNNELLKNPFSREMRDVFMEYEDTSRFYLSAKNKFTASWVCLGFSLVGLGLGFVGIKEENTGLALGSLGGSLAFSLTSLGLTFSSNTSLNKAISTYNNNAINKARQQR